MYVQSAMTCTQEDYIILHYTKPVCQPLTSGGNQQENTSIFKQGGVGVIPHSPPITPGDRSYSVRNGWIIIDFSSTAARP